MSSTNQQFWEDERGFVVSAELTMISTVLVLSLVVGMTGLSNTMTEEIATMSTSTNATLPVDRYSNLGLDQQQAVPQAPSPAISITSDSAGA